MQDLKTRFQIIIRKVFYQSSKVFCFSLLPTSSADHLSNSCQHCTDLPNTLRVLWGRTEKLQFSEEPLQNHSKKNHPKFIHAENHQALVCKRKTLILYSTRTVSWWCIATRITLLPLCERLSWTPSSAAPFWRSGLSSRTSRWEKCLRFFLKRPHLAPVPWQHLCVRVPVNLTVAHCAA